MNRRARSRPWSERAPIFRMEAPFLLITGFGAFAIAAIEFGIGPVPGRPGAPWELALGVACCVAGVALWRGRWWARWAVLAVALLVPARIVAAVRAVGWAHVTRLGVLVVVTFLVAMVFWVREVWREGPHVAREGASTNRRVRRA